MRYQNKMNINNKKKQKTFGAFGFTRSVIHRGNVIKVDIPDTAVVDEPTIKCTDCSKMFKNNQGLSVHMCTQWIIFSKPVLCNSSSTELRECDIFEDVKYVLQKTLNTVEANYERHLRLKRHASKRRHAHSAEFKAEVINTCSQPDVLQVNVAENFRIDQSMVSRWMKNRKAIMKEAAVKHRKMLKKGCKSTKYAELYEQLWNKFKTSRSKGVPVNFHWLWSKACVIQKGINENEQIKNHVTVRFLQKFKIRMRAKQRNKNKSKTEKIPALQKPHRRLNVDQSPLPYVINSKKTYEYIPPGEGATHNTWISQPGSGLDKRQCSLQVMFRSEGVQPRLAIIFRGTGARITDDEKLPWHSDIDVFFQPNGWMDTKVCLLWTEKTLKSFVEKEHLDQFVLLLDNLNAHCSDEFKASVSQLQGLVWYGLPGSTNLWHPVDARYAQVLKALIGIEHRDWLDRESNSDRWFNNENLFSAKERQIIITEWAGEAWKKLGGPQYDNLRHSCWRKTGC